MKVLYVTVLSVLLSGCAYGIVDRTNEQQELLSTCFSIAKPAFLYEGRCADLSSGGFGGSKGCTSIQGFDPLPYVREDSTTYEYHYPKSWLDYLSNRASWDHRLFGQNLFSKQRSIVAPIDVDTEIRIVGVYQYPRGESGRVLIVTAKLASGPFAGSVIELPSQGGFNINAPDWTTPEFYPQNGKIELSEEYLKPCAARSPS